MRLGLSAFKRIKPTDSVDDYESGSCGGESPAQIAERIRNAVWKELKDNAPISIKEVVMNTGASQGGVYNILKRWREKGLISFVSRSVPGAVKKASFYSLVESSQC